MTRTALRRTRKRRKTQEKPYVQFSKRMVTAIMLFWGFIRLVSVSSVLWNPDAGEHMAAIVRGVDDIAMCIVLAYTGNSISEKISTAYFSYKSKELQEEEEKDDDKKTDSNG